jgi:hypothetical protein
MLEYWNNGILGNQGEQDRTAALLLLNHHSIIPLLQKAEITQSTKGGVQR